MATRAIMTPQSAEYPASNYAEYKKSNLRSVLAFDASNAEAARWVFAAPQGLTTPLSLLVMGIMASATTGGVVLTGALEAITPGDSVDLDATESFDSVNTSSTVTVPGTAGYLMGFNITLTNNDAVAAGDYVRVEIKRDVSNAGDNAAGDFHFLAALLQDAS